MAFGLRGYFIEIYYNGCDGVKTGAAYFSIKIYPADGGIYYILSMIWPVNGLNPQKFNLRMMI
jgi:drug/metabolite transporter superfamily protein YnfA